MTDGPDQVVDDCAAAIPVVRVGSSTTAPLLVRGEDKEKLFGQQTRRIALRAASETSGALSAISRSVRNMWAWTPSARIERLAVQELQR